MGTRRNRCLLWAVLCAAALVAGCDKRPAPQEEEGGKGEHVDYVCTSCYRYVNGTSEPVTVEFHSAQYDLTPPPVEEAFTVAVGGRHEVSFAGFGLFPGPFCLGDDTWVKVAQGSGSSCSGRGMSRLFCSIRPHMNGSKETALPACTSIVSRTMILQGRKSSIDK